MALSLILMNTYLVYFWRESLFYRLDESLSVYFGDAQTIESSVLNPSEISAPVRPCPHCGKDMVIKKRKDGGWAVFEAFAECQWKKFIKRYGCCLVQCFKVTHPVAILCYVINHFCSVFWFHAWDIRPVGAWHSCPKLCWTYLWMSPYVPIVVHNRCTGIYNFASCLCVCCQSGIKVSAKYPTRPPSTFLLTGFPRSWKIIENPGKINFPGKSWKSHWKLLKIRKSWKNKKIVKSFGEMKKEQNF